MGREGSTRPPQPRPLLDLVSDVPRSAGMDGVEVNRITSDSRSVEPGDLFVALVGTRVDGHEFAADAVRRGAVAVVAERPLTLDVPVLQVPDTQRELARLAAEWYGRPAQSVPLVGITGTLGKTTVLAMMERILGRAGLPVGSVGSLGIRLDGEGEDTGYTAPGPLVLHEGLDRLVRGGAKLVVMEVTTHALTQERVHGLEYALGVFTNLVPLEHVDYHGSFRGYVEAKLRFFDHLRAGAPLVYSWDNRPLRGVVRGRDLVPVGVGSSRAAQVRFEILHMDAEGSAFLLRSRRPLPLIGGGEREPLDLTMRLPTLGRSMVSNAALAATAALVAGADATSVARALEDFPPPRRRLQVIRREPFLVLDDTTGHPDSLAVVFEVVQRLNRPRVHLVFAVRGQRGRKINRRTAEALAIWAGKVPLETLVITSSEEAADELNRVEPAERLAFLSALESAGARFEEVPRLDAAVRHLVSRVAPGDLVLLLGAQGMDLGAGALDAALTAANG
jgi:UDP-N-acetylmuramoyl-L-alanyl-D-glutamate--2,6-diaminopimelate ligase